MFLVMLTAACKFAGSKSCQCILVAGRLRPGWPHTFG